VRLEDDTVTVRPIAGTRPRGSTEAEDEAHAESLLSDEKELAEHLMLIDLGRNDAGRVSQTGTVKLTESVVSTPVLLAICLSTATWIRLLLSALQLSKTVS